MQVVISTVQRTEEQPTSGIVSYLPRIEPRSRSDPHLHPSSAGVKRGACRLICMLWDRCAWPLVGDNQSGADDGPLDDEM